MLILVWFERSLHSAQVRSLFIERGGGGGGGVGLVQIRGGSPFFYAEV